MEQLHKTRGDIQREEKCSPAFVLLNVDMLMRTDAPKDSVVADKGIAYGDVVHIVDLVKTLGVGKFALNIESTQ